MKISYRSVLVLTFCHFLNLSACIEFPYGVINPIIDSIRNLFPSPLIDIVRESWGAAIDEECVFKCYNGKYPKANLRHHPKSNGCGVPGAQMPKIPKYIPLGQLDECCASHDICYGTCNADKNECDVDFRKCLYNICAKFGKYVSEDILKGCKSVAKTIYVGVLTLGCKYYLDAQKEACICVD